MLVFKVLMKPKKGILRAVFKWLSKNQYQNYNKLLLLWPIATGAYSLMNQSEFLAMIFN